MNKKTHIVLPLLLSITLLMGMFFGYKLKENMGVLGPKITGNKSNAILREALTIIDRYYVDSVQTDSITADAIQSMLNHLDPHSHHIPAAQIRIEQEEIQGNFEGIGVEFELLNDTVCVVGVMPGSPAEKAGIRTGNKFIDINQTKVAGVGITQKEVIQLVRGPKESNLQTTVLQEQAIRNISLKRGRIAQSCIDIAYIIKPGIGYIRLNRFAATAYEDFMQELEKMKQKNITSFILDVRDNGGGVLDDAIQIADEFLDNEKEIVYTKGKSSPKQSFFAKRPGLFETGKLIILINEHSASASEVLAGALQDWERATIIGRRSFGKGLVQEQFNLSDGSALRLTVSRYFTPLGRFIQKEYQQGDDSSYSNEIKHRIVNGDLFKQDTLKKGKSYRTKSGRIVYGGGGITPDFFVGADSVDLLLSSKHAAALSLIEADVFRYYHVKEKEFMPLKQLIQLEQYLQQNKDFNSYLQASIKTRMKLPGSIPSNIEKNLIQRSYAFLIKLKLGTEAYFQYQHQQDPIILEALKQMN